jgi:tetratricopeptide (TPR) repeat protein
MEMTNDDAALHDYTEAIRLDPTNTWYLECRGELHASLTNFDAAIGDYTQCLQLQPTNAAYCCRRAGLEEASEWTAARLGHPTKARELRYQALKDLRQAAALDSARLSALGAFEYRHGLYADAITNYTKHLQWHPDDELAWISREFRAYACERAANNDAQRGDLKNKNAALEQALADWNQLAASAPNLETGSGFLCQRGNFYARNNQFAQALADYQRAVELAPASESSGWLALFLATCPDQKFRNGGQALVYARKAYEPNPSPDDIVLAGLAAAYAETGDFEQAVQFQQMALQAMDARQDQLETGGVGYLGCPDSFHSEMADRLLLYEQSRPCHKILGMME